MSQYIVPIIRTTSGEFRHLFAYFWDITHRPIAHCSLLIAHASRTLLTNES